MSRRIFIRLSVDTLLSKIAWNEANGFDFEAKTLRGLFTMTKRDKEVYNTYLESCKAAKLRREADYPEIK